MTEFPKQTELRARAGLACDIAGIDPDRFNEAVAAGHYECAPHTTSGVTRKFDLHDLLALKVYGRLLEGGFSPRQAGEKSCALRDFFRSNPDADQVYVLNLALGRPIVLSDFDVKELHSPGPAGSGGIEILSVEVWNFHYERGRIVHALNEAANTVG